MTRIVTWSKFVSSSSKANEIDEDYRGDTVTLTLDGGDTMKCEIVGTSETPDNEPLVLVRTLPLSEDGVGHVFACDIVQVEG